MADDFYPEETEKPQQPETGCEDCFEDEEAANPTDSAAHGASSGSSANRVWEALAFAGWNNSNDEQEQAGSSKSESSLASSLWSGLRSMVGGKDQHPAAKPEAASSLVGTLQSLSRNLLGGAETDAKPAEKPAETISDRIYSALQSGLSATIGWSIQEAAATKPAEADRPAAAKPEQRSERSTEASGTFVDSLASIGRTFLPEQLVAAGTAAVDTVTTAVQAAIEAPAPATQRRTETASSSSSDLSSLYAAAQPLTNLAVGVYSAASSTARAVVGDETTTAIEKNAVSAALGVASIFAPTTSAVIAGISRADGTPTPARSPAQASAEHYANAASVVVGAVGGGMSAIATAVAIESSESGVRARQSSTGSGSAAVDALVGVGQSLYSTISSAAGIAAGAVVDATVSAAAATPAAERPQPKPTSPSSESASSWFGFTSTDTPAARPEPKPGSSQPSSEPASSWFGFTSADSARPESKPASSQPSSSSSSWAAYGEQALRAVSQAAQESGYSTLAAVTNPENLKAAGDTIAQALSQAAERQNQTGSASAVDTSVPSKPVDRVGDTASFKPEYGTSKPESGAAAALIGGAAATPLDKPAFVGPTMADKPAALDGVPAGTNPADSRQATPTIGTAPTESRVAPTTPGGDRQLTPGITASADSQLAPGMATPGIESRVAPGMATPGVESQVAPGMATARVESRVAPGITSGIESRVAPGMATPGIDGTAGPATSTTGTSSLGTFTNTDNVSRSTAGGGLLAQLNAGNTSPEPGSCSAPAGGELKSLPPGGNLLEALENHNQPAGTHCQPNPADTDQHHDHHHHHHDHQTGGGEHHSHIPSIGRGDDSTDHHTHFSPIHHPLAPGQATAGDAHPVSMAPFQPISTLARTNVVDPVVQGPRLVDPLALSGLPGTKPAAEALPVLGGKPAPGDLSPTIAATRIAGELPGTFNIKVSELPVRLNALDPAAASPVLKSQLQMSDVARAGKADAVAVRAELPGRAVEPGSRVVVDGRGNRVVAERAGADRAAAPTTPGRIDATAGAVATFRVVKGADAPAGTPGRTSDGQPRALDGRAGRAVGPQNRYLIAELSLGLVLAAGGIRRVLPTDRNRNSKDGTSGTASSGKSKPTERALVSADRRPNAGERIISRTNERMFRTATEKPAAATPLRSNLDRATLDRSALNRDLAQTAGSKAILPFTQPSTNFGKQVIADTALGISKAIRGFGIEQQPALVPVLADGRGFLPRESVLGGIRSTWRPLLPQLQENSEAAVTDEDPDLFIEFSDPFMTHDHLTTSAGRLKKFKTPGKQGESLARGSADASSADEADEDASSQVLLRPTWLISEGETLVSIAEELFNDPNIGWLIADLNCNQSVEHWMDDKRIVEFSSRQQITLPVWQDIVEFYNLMPVGASPERLVTIVKTTQLDREVVDSTLSKVMGTKVHSAQSITASVQNNEKVLT